VKGHCCPISQFRSISTEALQKVPVLLLEAAAKTGVNSIDLNSQLYIGYVEAS